MCGIFGFVDLERPLPAGADKELNRMARLLQHRGPDGTGSYTSDCAALGATRLAIIDLAGGAQPVASEAGDVWALLNGEIYNHRELRKRLETQGHRFRTRCDTEVLVHLYEQDGPAFVHALRGMFAAAVWDVRRRRLVLARDRFGVKPLYYAPCGSTLFFASEIQALAAATGVERRLNAAALDHYFRYLTTPLATTIYEDVQKLPPAHRLILDAAGPRLERYWQLPVDPIEPNDPEGRLVEELDARLQEAIRTRLEADVPVGAFLSGGVDSSTVAALASEMLRDPIRTFSLSFSHGEFDESTHAARMAARIGARHTTVPMPRVSADDLRRIAWHFGEPFADTSALPTYFLSRAARRRVKVALGGDGGDEVFAGYGHHGAADRAAAVSEGSWSYPELFDEKERAFLYSDDLRARIGEAGPSRPYRDVAGDGLPADRLRRRLWIDLHHFLPNDMLTKVDRMSMAWGLEVRCPMLDHPLVEYVWSLPSSLKVRGRTRKYLLKRTVRGRVPHDILRRRKTGFALQPGLLDDRALRPLVGDLLSPARLRRAALLRPAVVAQLQRAYRDELGRRGISRRLHGLEHRLWAVVLFELWREVYVT